jgi:hypothetical protein
MGVMIGFSVQEGLVSIAGGTGGQVTMMGRQVLQPFLRQPTRGAASSAVAGAGASLRAARWAGVTVA